MLLAKKFFEFHAQVQKCHFGKIENGNKKKYSQLVPGSAKSRIYSGKSTKRGFSKKGLARINFFFLVLGSYESPEGLGR